MTSRDISEAKNPDLRASVVAMHRAAQLARETAIQTGTSIVIVKDSKLIHVSAQTLRDSRIATGKKSE
jgi:hypothetical protein